jgi:hypothetical protein
MPSIGNVRRSVVAETFDRHGPATRCVNGQVAVSRWWPIESHPAPAVFAVVGP